MKDQLKRIEQKLDLLLERTNTRFKPPTITEVTDYCLMLGYKNVEPYEFINFYEAKGWMIGKNKMKNWYAAVRNWESKSSKNNKPNVEKI